MLSDEFEIKNQLEALNSTLELCFPTISKKKKDALTFSELLSNNKNCFQTEKKKFFVSNKNDVIYLCSKNHQLKNISSKLNNFSMYREWKKQKVVVENLRHDINVLFNISRQNKVKHQINNLKYQRNIMKTKKNRSFHACLLMRSYNNNKKVSSTIKIDHWLKKKENEINTEKAAEVIRKNADMILFDVRTKRTGTKKFLSLLHELRNLRKIKRTHMELQENITIDRAEKVFNSIIDSLMIQWITLDKEYFMEETGLKLMIESNKRKQLHENEKKKSCKWLSLLFQNCSFCKCQVKNLKIIIFLRIIWDTFFNSGQGLKIPIGWIIPSQPYITAWTKCTVKNKVFT
ncbi:uncharacterized protein LOC106645771 [Copidosoma floridanum]|uniref:uncharacterized protein LOC106645771 n=1 Tax=Copidosoma floridanum TaxID=29053 RepID=UPI0006C991BD|nr:uncharacterized protein LOC106645771 [Copidosoma floridanum]